jgi:hypothetical protein
MFADGETRQVVVVVVEDAMYALAIVREPVCSLRGRYGAACRSSCALSRERRRAVWARRKPVVATVSFSSSRGGAMAGAAERN